MDNPLEKLLAELPTRNARLMANEQATCQGAVLPILRRIGWDYEDPDQVTPQFAVGDGRIDYCLRIGDQSKVFVEVKRAGLDLDQHQEQLLKYAFQAGVDLAVLTNGLLWWLYLPGGGGSWEQRRFFAVDITAQEPDKAARRLREFLQREAVASGEAVRRAKEMHESRAKGRLIQQTIPKAWRQLCEEPDEGLLDLLAERVESICGHRPGHEVLAEQLVALAKPAQAAHGDSSTLPPTKPPSPRPRGGYTGKRPRSYTFRGETRPVSTFKDILVGVYGDLASMMGADFERVLSLRGRKRAYFSREPQRLTTPQEVGSTGIYAETNLSANGIMDRCASVLALFGLPPEDLTVEAEDRWA